MASDQITLETNQTIRDLVVPPPDPCQETPSPGGARRPPALVSLALPSQPTLQHYRLLVVTGSVTKQACGNVCRKAARGFDGTKDILTAWTSSTNLESRTWPAAPRSLNGCAPRRSTKSSARPTLRATADHFAR